MIENNNLQQEQEQVNFIGEKIGPKKSGKKAIPLIIVGVLIVALIGIGVHFFIKSNNPKTFFSKASNFVFESLLETLEEGVNFTKTSYLYQGNTSIRTNVEDISYLDNQNIKYNLGVDLSKHKLEAGVELLENNKSILSVTGNIKNDNVYVDLGNLFNKVLLLDNQTFEDEMGISITSLFETLDEVYSEEQIENIKYIITSFQDITNDALGKVKYQTNNTKITLNGESISVKEMSLDFNYNNTKIIATTFADGILNNDKLLTNLSEYMGYDKEYLKEGLNDLKEEFNIDDELTEEEKNEVIFKISIYTKGIANEVVKLSIEAEGEEVLYYAIHKDYKILASSELIVEIKNQDLSVNLEGEEVIKGKVRSLEIDNIDLEYYSVDQNAVKGSIYYVNNESKMDFKFNIAFNNSDKISVNYNYNNISDSEAEFKIGFNMESDGEYLKVENNTKIYSGKEIANINTNNVLNINDLTENDMTTIMENIEEAFKNTKYSDIFNAEYKENFVTVANNIISGASQAMSLITIGSVSSGYTMINENTYCFTLQDLKKLGFVYNVNGYEGTVTVTKDALSGFKYRIEIKDDTNYAVGINTVTKNDVRPLTTDKGTVNIRTKCTK